MRQYVGWHGQKWTTLSRLSRDHKNVVEKVEQDLYSIVTEPEFAIGQRAFLVRTAQGNILWDCISYLDDETERKVRNLGGVDYIAISHPHYYSLMIQWSEAFDNAPILIHELDRRWISYHSPNIKLWSGVKFPLLKDLTLVNLGGHFDGGTVLHWKKVGGGILLSGDIIAVAMDRRWASFMYSFPNMIPLSRSKIEQIMERISPFRFQKLYSAFDGKEILSDALNAVRRSAKRYIRFIS